MYFIYSNVLAIFENLLERGTVPGLVGVWPVHVSTALVVLALLFHQASGRRWFGAKARRTGGVREADRPS